MEWEGGMLGSRCHTQELCDSGGSELTPNPADEERQTVEGGRRGCRRSQGVSRPRAGQRHLWDSFRGKVSAREGGGTFHQEPVVPCKRGEMRYVSKA